MIIDSHAHVFPSKIAPRAVESIGKFYDLPMEGRGVIEDLIVQGGRVGVDGFIVNSSATSINQVEQINRFIVASIEGLNNVWGLSTIHQDMSESEIAKAVDYTIANGLVGVKLHPDFQKFYIDDPNVYKIYEACSGKLPILMHAGDSRYEFSAPSRLAKVAREFPNLNIIAAHFGGFERWHEAECYRGLDNIYIDTSSSLFKLDSMRAKAIIRMIGEDKLLFGVDYPMWNYVDEMTRFKALELGEEVEKMAFSDNAARLFKLNLK